MTVNEKQTTKDLSVNRWRLILGKASQQSLGFKGDEKQLMTFNEMDELLDYLYSHGDSDDIRHDTPKDRGDSEDRSGGLGGSQLTAAKWISRVRELFPKSTAEVLEKQALDEFHMAELITDKKVLESLQPDMGLLKAVMQLRHLMKGEVLETAKKVARQVAQQIASRLEQSVKRSTLGRLDRNERSPIHTARNLDIKKTVQRNLKNYDKEHEQIMLKDIYFSSRVKKYNKKTVIIAIDESGSMLGSVIYSAVMAQIISKLPFAQVNLVIFDTSVVDLSGHVDEPAEVLMSVQLGGGTDIAKALSYCETLIKTPADTCILCVTDLYEGGSVSTLMNTSKNIIQSGAKLSFLTALDEDASPAYDKILGQKLADLGAFVGVLTPDELGDYVGRMFN
ncbi:MAG: VWA domain-containing protein [Ruminococcus sp.]|nr:VWA domain-containing protein [Ruminococcus sp.]